MPNRMLRDWTDSDKVGSLSVHSERFFVRLIMKVDDFGCFYADPRLLKANLFPLLLDSVREADLLRWMAECQKAGLIVIYESNNKRYLQICDFNQRLRQKKSKYPQPSIDGQLSVNCRLEVEENTEVEVEEKENATHANLPSTFIIPKNSEKKDSSPGPEILYTIEHCITVAMAHEEWVRDSKATPELLALFNCHLAGQGIYKKNPLDYKRHFYHWSKKQNATTQHTPKQSVTRKSAGAETLLNSLKADIAGLGS